MRICGHNSLLVWCLIPASLWQPCRSGRAEDSAPRFEITPNRALWDEQVNVRLLNLKPNQHVTVRASAGAFKSELEFKADAYGKIDLSGPEPDVAREQKVAPFRLVWSMKMDPDADPAGNTPDPMKITLSASARGEEVAKASFERLYLLPDVERVPVNEQKLRGVFFKPKAKGRYAGLLLLGGSEGGLNEGWAALLASRGYAVLALAYFDYEDRPQKMIDIPLEYFETGLQWLQRQESVQGDKLGLIGWSRGGELVLLLGARLPQIAAVVAYVPSHVVWQTSTNPKVVQTAAWTYQGKPIPNMGSAKVDLSEATRILETNPEVITPVFELYLKDEEAIHQAAIPVEKIQGPVLLITGKEDQLWPSAKMADWVMKRLAEHKHPYPAQHLSYAKCGHIIRLPNTPIGETRVRNPVTKRVYDLGGTAEGSAYASWDSWPRVLRFLDDSLKHKN